MSLVLIHVRQIACWPWELGWFNGSDVFKFATCRICERDVAQPVEAAKEVPVCIYCALDNGLMEALDVPFA